MKFNVVLGNPPFGSDPRHTDAGENFGLGKAFMYKMIDWTTDHVATVLPYGEKTYSRGAKEHYRSKGLYHIADARDAFPDIFAQTSVLYFDRKTKNQAIVDEMIGNVEVPSENMSPFFSTNTGTGRGLWEHLLKEEGKYEVVITVRKTLYTDDEEVVRTIDDKTRGKWRVVMNHIAGEKDLGRMIVVGPDVTLGKSVDVMICHSQEHAEAVRDYLETDEVSEILHKVKIGITNSAKILKYVPRPNWI
jgi:hypothetical protein